MTQAMLVSMTTAKVSASVVELADGRRRVEVDDAIGDCWYRRCTYPAPISRAAAQRLVNECATAAGPTQAAFLAEATK